MNILVATSPEISSDFSGSPNSKNAPFILDNPNPFVGTIPCPTTVSATKQLAVTNTTNGVIQSLVIFTVGQGVITPVLTSVKVGQTFSLTAHPDPGSDVSQLVWRVSSTQPDDFIHHAGDQCRPDGYFWSESVYRVGGNV